MIGNSDPMGVAADVVHHLPGGRRRAPSRRRPISRCAAERDDDGKPAVLEGSRGKKRT
jgi:hypothetical protein